MPISYTAKNYLMMMLDEGCYMALYEKATACIKRRNIYELYRPASGGAPAISSTYRLSLEGGILTVEDITTAGLPLDLPYQSSYIFSAQDGHPHFDGASVIIGIGDVRNINGTPNPSPEFHHYNLRDYDIVFAGVGFNKLDIWYQDRQVVSI